jgi:hypothetical protein
MNKDVKDLLATVKLRRLNWRIIKRASLVVVAIVIILGLYFELPKQIENYDATHLYHNKIFGQIKQLGGSEICNSGSSGYSSGGQSAWYYVEPWYHLEPWYQAYYWLPSRANLTAQVKAIAARDGYPLTYDAETVGSLQAFSAAALADTQDPEVIPPPFPQGTVYSQVSSYLTGHKGEDTLSIILNRQTSVIVNCSSRNGIYSSPVTGSKVIAIVTVIGSWKPTRQHTDLSDF